MALDTFNPYLFVSAGEQSNKFLTPTYAGGIAKFQTQRVQALSKLLVQINPVQDLNGQANPYPPGGGKNKLENTAQTATQSGVTFTVNEDGTVFTSGTSTENANHIVLGVMTLPAGDYVLSGCPSGGSASTFYIIINSGSTASSEEGVRVATDIGSGAEFTLSEATEICVWMACDNGQVMNNKVFKPMIRLASVTDGTYAPYSNICPISGWTGMTVTRLGKNILDPSYMVRGTVFVDNGNGTYTFSKTGTGASGRITWSAPVVADNGTTVTFSANITGTHASEIYFGFTLDENTSGANVECTIANGRITGTITSTAYMNGLRLYWRNNSTGVGTDSVVLSNMQVEYGSNVTAYEPYTKQTYPVTWETEAGTVYGGTLDVVSGVLTVDRVCVTFTENDDWTGTGSVSGGSLRYYVYLPVAPDTTKSGTTTICSCATFLTGNNGVWGTYNYNANIGAFTIKNGDGGAGFTSLDDFKTWLSTHPVQLCYYLATPQTYNITPTDVKTLAGFNQIYSDAGPVIDIQF